MDPGSAGGARGREARSIYVLVYALDPPRVLLLRRPEARAAGWQSVTGRVEPEDADLAAACRREIQEETGLPPPDEVRDLAYERSFLGYDGVTYHQRSFAARYHAPLDVSATPEHEEARWAAWGEAMALVRWDTDREALAWLAVHEPRFQAEAAFK